MQLLSSLLDLVLMLLVGVAGLCIYAFIFNALFLGLEQLEGFFRSGRR